MKANRNVWVRSSLRIAQTALAAALLVLGKFALSFVPNIEVVTTLTVVFAFSFGWQTLAATTIFCLVDAIIYPATLDVIISYFIYWNLLALVTIVLKKCGIKAPAAYIGTALVMTVGFGFLTSFVFHLFYGVVFWAYYAAGLPFYALQICSTLVFMTVGFIPLVKLLRPFVNMSAAGEVREKKGR